jgi:hypothetical protein
MAHDPMHILDMLEAGQITVRQARRLLVQARQAHEHGADDPPPPDEQAGDGDGRQPAASRTADAVPNTH